MQMIIHLSMFSRKGGGGGGGGRAYVEHLNERNE